MREEERREEKEGGGRTRTRTEVEEGGAPLRPVAVEIRVAQFSCEPGVVTVGVLHPPPRSGEPARVLARRLLRCLGRVGIDARFPQSQRANTVEIRPSVSGEKSPQTEFEAQLPTAAPA